MTAESIEVVLARLQERLEDMHDDIRATRAQAELSNGRITVLELGNAVREGRRQERERLVEDARRRRALSLAAHGWLRPTLGGGLVVGAVEVLKHLM